MDNRGFWNHRYQTLPELGSGPGSRGYAAAGKNQLIKRTITEHGIRSILDVGCGDLCWLDDEIIHASHYIGLDVADVVIEANARRHHGNPSVEFLIHDISKSPFNRKCDLVVCFDVLIHQIDRTDFDASLRHLIMSISNVGLVSYLTQEGVFGIPQIIEEEERVRFMEDDFKSLMSSLPVDRKSADTAFHAPLPEAISAIFNDVAVEPLAQYRRQTVYIIRKKS